MTHKIDNANKLISTSHALIAEKSNKQQPTGCAAALMDCVRKMIAVTDTLQTSLQNPDLPESERAAINAAIRALHVAIADGTEKSLKV